MSIELYGPLAGGNKITRDGLEQFVQEMEYMRRLGLRSFYEILFRTMLNISQLPREIISYSTNSISSGTNLEDTNYNLTTLGIGVGDTIFNITDNSTATVSSITTNNIVTTQLSGGNDNTWENGDEWRLNTSVTVNATRHGFLTDVMSSNSLITKIMVSSATEYLKIGQLPNSTYSENVLLRETPDGARKTKIQNIINALKDVRSF